LPAATLRRRFRDPSRCRQHRALRASKATRQLRHLGIWQSHITAFSAEHGPNIMTLPSRALAFRVDHSRRAPLRGAVSASCLPWMSVTACLVRIAHILPICELNEHAPRFTSFSRSSSESMLLPSGDHSVRRQHHGALRLCSNGGRSGVYRLFCGGRLASHWRRRTYRARSICRYRNQMMHRSNTEIRTFQ
jgi:hypothetical protein